MRGIIQVDNIADKWITRMYQFFTRTVQSVKHSVYTFLLVTESAEMDRLWHEEYPPYTIRLTRQYKLSSKRETKREKTGEENYDEISVRFTGIRTMDESFPLIGSFLRGKFLTAFHVPPRWSVDRVILYEIRNNIIKTKRKY